MALRTLGSNATTSLSAQSFTRQMLPADTAAICNGIKNDQINGRPIYPGAFKEGRLFIPNRGVLLIQPGDYVAFDSRGWPILLSADTIANGLWTHT